MKIAPGACAFLVSWSAAHAAITVSDSSLLWSPMVGNYDYLADQQTGSASADIVGVGSDYGLFMAFNNNDSTSNTDGTLGFRLRLDAAGGSSGKPAFDRVAWIGIDANIDGTLDVFLGLNLQGSSAEIGIYAPGNSANTSPKTTSINSSPVKTYALTTANFNYRPVNYATDGGTTNDVTISTSGDPDYYVSFMVPFTDVVSFLSTRSISITDQSPIRYVSATSTQTNSLNQDLGGVNGNVNSTSTWSQLGGFSETVNVSGNIVAVPEASSALLAMLAFGTGLWIRRR